MGKKLTTDIVKPKMPVEELVGNPSASLNRIRSLVGQISRLEQMRRSRGENVEVKIDTKEDVGNTWWCVNEILKEVDRIESLQGKKPAGVASAEDLKGQ